MTLNLSSKLFLAILLPSSLFSFTLVSVSPTVGVITAIGPFSLNGTEVEGNANLFDGSQIRTQRASSQVYLRNGRRLVLGLDTAGTIYQDHLALENGATKVVDMTGYAVVAGPYRIRAVEPKSEAIVQINKGKVEVASLRGAVEVGNGQGVWLARIAAGTGATFQSGASTGPSGASTGNGHETRKLVLYYVLAGAAFAGLGLAVAAILQPASTSP